MGRPHTIDRRRIAGAGLAAKCTVSWIACWLIACLAATVGCSSAGDDAPRPGDTATADPAAGGGEAARSASPGEVAPGTGTGAKPGASGGEQAAGVPSATADSNRAFNQLLADGDEQSLIEAVDAALSLRASLDGFEALSEPQRNVRRAWSLHQQILQDGLHKLLASHADGALGIAALDEVGAEEHANLMLAAWAVLPDSPPSSLQLREALLDNLEDAQAERLFRLEQQYIQRRRWVPSAIAAYVRHHADDFRVLDPLPPRGWRPAVSLGERPQVEQMSRWLLQLGCELGIAEHGSEQPTERHVESADHLPQGGFEIVELQLPEMRNDIDALLERVATDLPDLRSLVLDGAQLSSQGLSRLSALAQLRSLSLRQTDVGDDDLAALAQLPRLEHLSLAETLVAGAGLSHLAAAPSLLSLDLTGNEIDDAEIAGLAGAVALSELNLHQTQVTPSGLSSLASLPQLSYVYLTSDALDNDDLAKIAQLPRLRRLDLSFSRVTDSGLRALGRLARLESLTLRGTELSDAGLKQLGSLTTLRELDLSQTLVSDEGLKELASLTSLEHLLLEQNAVGDRGLEHLGGLTKLETLSLYGAPVTRQGLLHLSQLKSLRSLNLKGSFIGDDSLGRLTALTKLEFLSLEATGVTDQGVTVLAGRLPQLTGLELAGTRVTDEVIPLLGRSTISTLCSRVKSSSGNDS